MTVEETYPIHRCIFRNDIDGLEKYMKDEEIKKLINTKDNHGNTPIHLALMLDRRNCILCLIKNGCDCVSRNNFGWNPFEEATMLGDIDLIEKLAKLKFENNFDFFNRKDGPIDQWNKILPSFHFKFQMKIKSKVPIFNKLGIKDIGNLYKKGKNFRLDFGFSGVDLRTAPRMMRGSLSILCLVNDNGKGRILLLDNKAKRYTELYPETSPKILDSYINSKMNVKTMYKFYSDNTLLRIKKKSGSSFGFKKNKNRVIYINGNEKYNTDLYKFKDSQVIIRKRDNEQIIGDYKSHIKTTVTDLDKSRNNVSLLSSEFSSNLFDDKKVQTFTKEDMIKIDNMIDESQSDSDNDDSDIESDGSPSQSANESFVKLPSSENTFKQFIDDNLYNLSTVDSEVSDKIIQLILCGTDEKGQKIETDDILYVHLLLPSFYSAYIKEHRLPDDQQAQLEEIYQKVVKDSTGDLPSKDIKDNEYVSNFKKSQNVSNMVHNITENYYNTCSSSSKKSTASSIESSKSTAVKREPITEEEYFNPAHTESLHMGRVMEISEEKKMIKSALKCWLTKEKTFPLNCYHIKPIIDVICLIMYDQINVKESDDDYDRMIYYNTCNYIFKEIKADERFPLKLEIPIFKASSLQFKFLEVHTETVSDDLFKVPENYIYDENVAFRFIR